VFDAVVGASTIAVFIALGMLFGRLRRSLRRRRSLAPRVLWGPIPIINVRYASLADRVVGYRSETPVYDVYRINDRATFDHVVAPRSRALRALAPYCVFLWAAARFDVFCFYFDGGLLYSTPWWRAELVLLRLAGAKIIVLPYGGDARLPSVTRKIQPWNIYSDAPRAGEDRPETDVAARIEAFGRYAHVMLGCADLVEDLPRVDGVFRFPYDAGARASASGPGHASVRVVHAPNHRHYKGTRFLIDAVEALRSEGVAIELDLVEGLPNHEALQRYALADIVADQFLAGAYALFAIEAMSLGKPVLCYLNPRFAPWHPEWSECPIVSASPDQLLEQLRLLATDRRYRQAVGDRGPAYVEKWHSLESVGRDMAAHYTRVLS